jgi:YfiH family protein
MVGLVPEAEVPLLRWADAGDMGAEVAVTTRLGGVSRPPYDTLNLGLHVGDDPADVAANRRLAADAFGVEISRLVFARQVHGAGAAAVGDDDAGRGAAADDDAVADADILITTTPGVALVIIVADCAPLALIDARAGVLAVVHAGWRGTAAGVVGVALEAMVERGAAREHIRTWIGPAVAPERYQVTDEVRRALEVAVGPAPLDREVARPDGPGHWLVDLVAANTQQLRRGGVPAGHVSACGVTTADGRFFSDRAARPCGRFALMARLVE